MFKYGGNCRGVVILIAMESTENNNPTDEEEWNSLKLAFNPLLNTTIEEITLRVDQKFSLETELEKKGYLEVHESARREVSSFFATSKENVFSVKSWRTKLNTCKFNCEQSKSFFENGSLTLASTCLKALDLDIKNFLSDLKSPTTPLVKGIIHKLDYLFHNFRIC